MLTNIHHDTETLSLYQDLHHMTELGGIPTSVEKKPSMLGKGQMCWFSLPQNHNGEKKKDNHSGD